MNILPKPNVNKEFEVDTKQLKPKIVTFNCDLDLELTWLNNIVLLGGGGGSLRQKIMKILLGIKEI